MLDSFKNLKKSKAAGWLNLLFRKPESASPDDSDKQMLLRVAWQFFWLFIVLLFFEDLLDLVTDVVHSVFEILHLLIEFLEGLVEEILEHLLHTDHHQSETIIVNAVLLLGFYVLYRLFRALPRIFRRIKRNYLAAWLNYKRRKYSYWRALSSTQKIKLTAAYSTGLALLLFWLTL
ncbi:MAG: hypothetical protein CVV06_00505 [Gammaproteobacteria bacterium HGW-Gammaproteobacteria-10]|nr:MAG: hypothetical protein CVV06_00505 [Gammaproteobacteria bacterium HGW-Gammaproteobacteria-10]